MYSVVLEFTAQLVQKLLQYMKNTRLKLEAASNPVLGLAKLNQKPLQPLVVTIQQRSFTLRSHKCPRTAYPMFWLWHCNPYFGGSRSFKVIMVDNPK